MPGHWEGDLLLGRSGRSQVGVIVERTSRLVQLIALPEDRETTTVKDAVADRITELPEALVRSLTWDRGRRQPATSTSPLQIGVQVYFCDLHSPWQRGTAENTHRLLHQYLPRNLDLSEVSPERLDEIADEMNEGPRETLDRATPSEHIAEYVALTT